VNFRQFLENNPLKIQNQFSQNTVGTHNDYATAALLPSTWTGSENPGLYSYGLPGTDIAIPNVVKKSKIKSIEINRNPIVVMLADGTKIYLSIDEFNRINARKKLEVGNQISVTFQRNPEDQGSEPSKIIAVESSVR
jgi:hypothetical protein